MFKYPFLINMLNTSNLYKQKQMINYERAMAPRNLLGYSWLKTSFKDPLEFLSKVSSLLILVCALP